MLLSLKVSHLPLSHLRRYAGVQERSLDFARDDVAGAVLFQYVRCTLRGIKPSTVPSFRAQSRNPPCTLFFLAPFAEGFQFYFVTHTTLYRCARKIEGFARDDVAEMAFSKHIRCTLREINPFSHTIISSAARNLPCTLLFLAPFAKVFPFFRYHTYDFIPSCKKDPSASLGMTIQE